MCHCLTPAPWAIVPERREVPFRDDAGTEGWRKELFERIDVWQTWLFELGGRTFIEPPPPTRIAVTYKVMLDYGTFLASFDTREDALGLFLDMRLAGFDVRIERERRRT